MPISDQDKLYLRQAVTLASEALTTSDEPFGSLLVDQHGKVVCSDRNRVNSTNNVTAHPEFTIVLYAQKHMTPAERAASTVYTSGEHCAMCSSAHGYAGLGRIVFASSSEQLGQWKADLGATDRNVTSVGARQILANCVVDGPDEELAGEVKKLHVLQHSASKG